MVKERGAPLYEIEVTIRDRVKSSRINSSSIHRQYAFSSAKYSGIIGSSEQEMQASLRRFIQALSQYPGVLCKDAMP